MTQRDLRVLFCYHGRDRASQVTLPVRMATLNDLERRIAYPKVLANTGSVSIVGQMLLRPRSLLNVRLSTRRIKKPILESLARLLRKRLVQFGVIDCCSRANPRQASRDAGC